MSRCSKEQREKNLRKYLSSVLISLVIHIAPFCIQSEETILIADHKKEMPKKINTKKYFELSATALGSSKSKFGGQINLSNLGIENNYFNTDYEAKLNQLGGIGRFGDSKGEINGKGIKHSFLYRELYNFIKASLSYPSFFVKEGIHGLVQGRLVFNKKGEFLVSESILSSQNKYLLKHVNRIFCKNTFKQKIPFDVSFIKYKYLLIDVSIYFQNYLDFSQTKTLKLDKHKSGKFNFYFQRSAGSVFHKWKNSEGDLSFGINPLDLIDLYKEKVSERGRVKRKFHKDYLSNLLKYKSCFD